MMIVRNTLWILATFMLVACGALPGQPDQPSLDETPVTMYPPAQPGTLAASIPVAEWRGNANSHFLFPLNPDNGQPLTGYEPIELGQAIVHAFSPHLDKLAVIGFASSQNPVGGNLHLIELNTWEHQIQELKLDGYVNAMAFSPDGKKLAVAYGSAQSQVLLLDVREASKKLKTPVRQTLLDFLVYKMDYTADGSGLMLYGSRIENRYTVNEMSPDPALVTLLDSADLSQVWEASLEGVRHGVVPKENNGDDTADLHQPGQAIYLLPGLAFASGQDRLYVAHPDEDKITTVDFGARTVRTLEIKPQLSLVERLLSLTAGIAHAKIAEGTSKQAVLSPDGRYLYIIGQRSDLLEDKDGNWQVLDTPLGLQIVDTKDGSRVARIDTQAREVSISPDGRSLYLRGWGDPDITHWTQIFDTTTKTFTARMDGMWLVPTRRANGAPILGSTVWVEEEGEHHNAVADSHFQSVLAEWTSPEYLAWLTTR